MCVSAMAAAEKDWLAADRFGAEETATLALRDSTLFKDVGAFTKVAVPLVSKGN